MRFTGIRETASDIINAHNAEEDRQDFRHQRKALRRAGDKMASGDTQGASAELQRFGMIDEGNSLLDRDRKIKHEDGEHAYTTEERGRKRAREDSASSILSEAMKTGTPEAMQAASSELAKTGSAELALDVMSGAKKEKSAADELQRVEKAQSAQAIMNGYVTADRRRRREFVLSVLNNSEYANDITPDVRAMIESDDPTDDDAAVAKWVTEHGGDASPLMAEIEDERRHRREKEIEGIKSASKKAEAAGELGGLHPRLRNMPNGVISKAYEREDKLITEAGETAARAQSLSDLANEFQSYLTDKGIGEGYLGSDMYSGTAQAMPWSGGVNKYLDGLTEKMIMLTREPGTGAFTDADAQRAEKYVLNRGLEPGQLATRGSLFKRVASRAKRYEEFLNDYQLENGVGSLAKAKRIWGDYLKDNEFFVESGGKVAENPNTQDFEDWYDAAVSQSEAASLSDEELGLEDD